jgi:hypothetical protein
MSVEFLQRSAQSIGTRLGQSLLGFGMRLRPHRCSGDKERPSGRRQNQSSAAFVRFVHFDLDQAAAFERLERGRERRAIHRKQVSNVADARRIGAIERYQQRKLTLRQTERAQRVVEAPRQRPRRPLDVKAKAIVANMMRERDRQIVALGGRI